jgi:denticleless
MHENGIFDVQWSATDDRIATASADLTTRITDITTGRGLWTLQGHTSTVKTISWDPSNPNLLSTGGRDGCICLWDLRISERMQLEDGVEKLTPVTTIRDAHGDLQRHRGRKPKIFMAKAVTSIVYAPDDPLSLISSGSANGCV